MIRKAALFVLALVFVALAWELYKLVGPEAGGSLAGVPLPKTSDRAMPHTWDMVTRLGEPENRAGGADDRPRSVPIAIGKNARNAASAETVIQRGTSQPNGLTRPLQLTTCGASAINGTVWLMITHGRSPRSTMRNRDMNTASPIPTTVAITKPNSASRNVYHA